MPFLLLWAENKNQGKGEYLELSPSTITASQRRRNNNKTVSYAE